MQASIGGDTAVTAQQSTNTGKSQYESAIRRSLRQLPCRGITIEGVTHQIMPLKVIYKATFGEGCCSGRVCRGGRYHCRIVLHSDSLFNFHRSVI